MGDHGSELFRHRGRGERIQGRGEGRGAYMQGGGEPQMKMSGVLQKLGKPECPGQCEWRGEAPASECSGGGEAHGVGGGPCHLPPWNRCPLSLPEGQGHPNGLMLTWLLCKTRSKCRFSRTRECVCGGHDSPITWEQQQEALLQLLPSQPPGGLGPSRSRSPGRRGGGRGQRSRGSGSRW